MQKLFTVDEANATLPLVRRIVQDIVTQYARWEDAAGALELAGAAADASDPQRVVFLERTALRLAAEVDALRRELTELGIVLKDERIGLIDFPAVMGGRLVWLCWHLGEPAVEFWHEMDTGFAGRRPLAPAPV
ncbi:MAG: DUF2203 domain-containing protein [Gemmatimonadaceae bacterium]